MWVEGVEQDPTTKKVRCVICKEADPLGLGSWINKGSLHKHLDSDSHQTQVARKAQREQQASTERARLQAVYNGATALPDDNFRGSAPDSRPGFFDFPDANHDIALPGPSHQWTEPLIPMPIAPIIHDPSSERERLQQQFEEMLRQAEHDDEFGVNDSFDDITATNISGEFTFLGAPLFVLILQSDLHESPFTGIDATHDEDEAQDPFDHIPIHSDYAPYPNKIVSI
jgi:hypothetical protein